MSTLLNTTNDKTTFFTYQDSAGLVIVCKGCMTHSRKTFDVECRHCSRCWAYHTDEGKLLARNRAAEKAYRAAWVQRCLAFNDRARRTAEQVMDALQSCIGRNPKDPRYYWFIRTLPGFLEFWEGALKNIRR